uniref:Restriction alleviation protein n=1 Tax=viral metagenome TaxID=1070528 RepID=A0A6M3LLZ6_9ZZZZ
MTCPICNGKQLLPFIKNGKTILNAWVNCECKTDEPEQYHELRPEDFDYPCSSFFREYYTEQWGLPSEQRTKVLYLDYESPKETEQQPWDKRQQYQLDQTRSQLMHIQHQLHEHIGRKPVPPQQPRKSEYKGLVIKDE